MKTIKKKFKESINTAVYTTRFVIKENSPILYISHDIDGDWQFFGIEENVEESDAMIVGLGEIIELDPSILDVSDLPTGKKAIRNNKDEPWKILS